MLKQRIQEILQPICFDDYCVLNEIDEESIAKVLKYLGLSEKTTVEKLDQRLVYLKERPKKTTKKFMKLLGAEDISTEELYVAIDEIFKVAKTMDIFEDALNESVCEKDISAKKTRDKTKEINKTVNHKNLKKNELVSEAVSTTEPQNSKRFDKFHKNWSGNENWKKSYVRDTTVFQDDALDIADDDDYLSSWLACLQQGIPWGGRGCGGRGIQRVTGESRNVLVQKITLSRGTTSLLENATLKLNDGKRYALIGLNGSGKTSLIRRIATGRLPGFPPHLSVQQVQQELNFTTSQELSELLPVEFVLKFDYQRTELFKKEAELLTALESSETNKSLTDVESNLQQQLSDVYAELDIIDAYNTENKAKLLLIDLGFTENLLKTKVSNLSGGWKVKCSLAGSILTNPDILLMDEPTNNLDIQAVKQLETFINSKTNFKGTILIISHDRSFINNVCNELILVKNKQLNYFSGTYQEYLEIKKQKLATQMKKSDALNKQKDHLKKIIENNSKGSFSQNTSKQREVKIRKNKLKRLESIGYGRKSGHRYKVQVDHSSHKYQEHLPQAIDIDPKPVFFKFPSSISTSISKDEILVSLSEISLTAKETLLINNFTISIKNNSRIGIIGSNGCGKSTLMKVLFDKSIKTTYAHCTGEVIINRKCKVAYISQDLVTCLDQKLTACELIMKESERIKKENKVINYVNLDTVNKARSYLGSFGLNKNNITLRPLETLSGGQKTRFSFAFKSLIIPDLLILDEPSNNLDIESIEALTKAINEYKGTVLIISHDRTLLSQTVDVIWKFNKKQKQILTYFKDVTQTRQEFVFRYC